MISIYILYALRFWTVSLLIRFLWLVVSTNKVQAAMGESIAMMVFIVVGDIFSFPFILIIIFRYPNTSFWVCAMFFL